MPARQIEQLFLERLHHLEVAERLLILQGLLDQRGLIERVEAVVGAYDVPRFLESRGRERVLAFGFVEHGELAQRADQGSGLRTARRYGRANVLGDAFRFVCAS